MIWANGSVQITSEENLSALCAARRLSSKVERITAMWSAHVPGVGINGRKREWQSMATRSLQHTTIDTTISR